MGTINAQQQQQQQQQEMQMQQQFIANILAGMSPVQKQKLLSDPAELDAIIKMKQENPEAFEKYMNNKYKDYKGDRSSLDKQMKTANALRGSETPKGRQMGQVYQAANPMEHMASAYKQRKGLEDYESAQGKQESSVNNFSAALRGRAEQEMVQRQADQLKIQEEQQRIQEEQRRKLLAQKQIVAASNTQ